MTRNWNDPVYKNWRKQVYARDKFSCQWPNCGSKKRLNAHHIKKWADNPGLRFNLNNGITLCRKCHDNIKNKEVDYEKLFFKILIAKSLKDGKE